MNNNNKILCELQDELEEKVNLIHDAVINLKSNKRLIIIVNGAKGLEQLSKQIQHHVQSMLRKNEFNNFR